jgi:tRNA uridine 5-carboxymethylaminomethyl modification enzyme
LNRPQITLLDLAGEVKAFGEFLERIEEIDREEIIEAAEIEIKYHGYISRERALADKMQRLENIKIRGHFVYNEITQLSTEARQKLTAIDPETLAQAGRIPGVSPNDISVLLVLLGR